MLTFNYQYRIYPTTAQEEILTEWMEICRGAYNYALREIKDWLNSRKSPIDRCSLISEYIIPAEVKFPGELNQLNSLPKAKKEFPRLGQVPAQTLQQTIKQLHRSWEYFQKRGYGFPRFKKRGQFKSLLFPQFKENPVSNLHLHLPKLGAIPINLHRPIPEGFEVKQVRMVRKADRWYAIVCIQCAVSVPEISPHGHPIGIDTGVSKFLATSDNLIIKPPKFFKTLQSKLKLLHRRLSRKEKRSNNYQKQQIKVARLHHQIDNSRKNFHYQTAHKLCDTGDMFFVEDLDYRTLAQGFLGKEMLDAGCGQFRTILKQVCWQRGKFFSEVNARGTSQECPECGGIVKKDLSVRIHHCPHCQYTCDRDVAAGQVIRNRGVEMLSTVGMTGTETVCAVELPGIEGETQQSRQVAKPRQGKTRKV